MQEFAEGNACRLRSTDERDALVGNHELSRVELAQKLLLNWMPVVGTDAVTNARMPDRETHTLAPANPLCSGLIASQRRGGDPARALAAFQNQRTLDVGWSVRF